MDNEINYQNFPYIYEQYLGGNFETFMRGIAEIIDEAKEAACQFIKGFSE